MTDRTEPGTNRGMRRESLFPSDIFFWDVPGVEALNRELLSAVQRLKEQDQETLEHSNVASLGGWHSDYRLHDLRVFRALVKIIHEAAREVSETLRYSTDYVLTVDQLWAIVNPPGSYLRTHNHPLSLWSGVYYLEAPSNSGTLVFLDPRSGNTMFPPEFEALETQALANLPEVHYVPSPGRLILFPSFLHHRVEANLAEPSPTSTGNRISLSMNLTQHFRGKPS